MKLCVVLAGGSALLDHLSGQWGYICKMSLTKNNLYVTAGSFALMVLQKPKKETFVLMVVF